jgi:hypothetical protein
MNQKDNWWLSDNYYLDSTTFKDKLYLHELVIEVREYIFKAPVPIVSFWIDEKHSILFKVGKDNHKLIKVSVDIATKDFVTLIEHWSKQFYPQYKVEEIIEKPLTQEEKIQGIKEGLFNLDESFNRTKKTKIQESGIITRVFFMEDKFTILINGHKQVRLTGNYSTPLPISVFLKNIRKIKDPVEKKAYIFNYSTKQNDKVKEKEILINYIGKKLINFFKINREELSRSSFEEKEGGFYKVGRFLINMRNSESILQEAKEIIETQEITNGIIN